MGSAGPMQAILLAAGDASRLAPLSHHRPKGMLLLGGKPILQHAVEALVGNGVTRIVIVTGTHGERIQSFFADGEHFDCHIEYAHQSTPSGTADAVRVAVPHLEDNSSTLIVPGHLLFSARSIRPIFRTDDRLLLADATRSGHQWVPIVDSSRIESIQSLDAVPGSTRVSSGIFHASQAFIAALEAELADCRQVDEAIDRFARDHKVHATDAKGVCLPVMDPWDMLRLNDGVLDQLKGDKVRFDLADQKPPIQVGANASISPTASIIGPVTIGDGCTIGDRTVIGPYVSIRNNSVIGSHCEVRRSIINNNVVVDSRAVIRGSILDDGVQCGPGFIVAEDSTPDGPRGCIIGADATIGADALAKAGAVVPPGADVDDRALIQGA